MQIETIIQIKNNSQVKESWIKPEINLLAISHETLGNFHAGPDTTGGS